MSDPILVTENLEKRFGGVVAASEISLSLYPGETVAVIGSNGAGKTTFVNMVTGYLKPSSGTIRFRGRDITGSSPRKTAQAGIRRSFQISQIFPQLTALENMMMAEIAAADGKGGLRATALTDTRMKTGRAVLDRFGLSQHADARVGTLPQGVKKQLDIAMAAIDDPALILLGVRWSVLEPSFYRADAVWLPFGTCLVLVGPFRLQFCTLRETVGSILNVPGSILHKFL